LAGACWGWELLLDLLLPASVFFDCLLPFEDDSVERFSTCGSVRFGAGAFCRPMDGCSRFGSAARRPS
jgi:hypothetical protein